MRRPMKSKPMSYKKVKENQLRKIVLFILKDITLNNPKAVTKNKVKLKIQNLSKFIRPVERK